MLRRLVLAAAVPVISTIVVPVLVLVLVLVAAVIVAHQGRARGDLRDPVVLDGTHTSLRPPTRIHLS